jgi:hypothetical protein
MIRSEWGQFSKDWAPGTDIAERHTEIQWNAHSVELLHLETGYQDSGIGLPLQIPDPRSKFQGG